MNSSDKLLLEFVTRIAYNVQGLSSELKLYFSQFLVFHFSKTLSKNQIQDIENKRASKVINNNDEIRVAASTFSEEEKIWAVASIQLLKSRAEKIDDKIVARRIDSLLINLVSVFEFQNETAKIDEQRHQIENEIYQFQNRPVLKINTRIWPLALDYILRWILLLGSMYFGVGKDFLSVTNIFLVPIFILALVAIVRRLDRKVNKRLISAFGEEHKFKIEYHVSTSQYTWLTFFLGSSVFISYLLPDKLQVLALLGLLLYYFIYLRFFRVGRFTENELIKQLEAEKINTQSLTVDQNDEVIVALETKLFSSTSRLEAYVLESALFGALSFSGFLQIMATDLISFDDLEKFASYIYSTSEAFIHFDSSSFYSGLEGLGNKKSLFCLVSVESLICSIFFLAVIASRLRFSDIADRVRTILNLAKAYNAKEEILHDEQEVTGRKIGRIDLLTAKVNEQLHLASQVLEEIKPVMTYMEYFRNAGILVFLIILVSSSLFITSGLGWIFLMLVLATYFYFNRSSINTRLKAFFLSFRIQFIKKGYWLLGSTFLPMIMGYVLRIFFHVRETDVLFVIGYVMLGLYIFTWLILAAHIDEKFGEIEMDIKKQKRWNFIKNFLAVVILMFFIALSFKELRLAGANEMMLLSLMSIAVSMYFVGYYLTKVWWLGIICGAIVATCCVGALFKTLHLAGANEMILVPLYAFTIFIPFIIWKRQLFHWLLLRFFVVGFLVAIWFNPFFYQFQAGLRNAYMHETIHVKEIEEVPELNDALLTDIESKASIGKYRLDLEKSIQKDEWYKQKFGTRFGHTNIYHNSVYVYWNLSNMILVDSTKNGDKAYLEIALKAARAGHSIMKLFHYDEELPWDSNCVLMEGKALEAMGKKEEALQMLEDVLQSKPFTEIAQPLIELKTKLQTKS